MSSTAVSQKAVTSRVIVLLCARQVGRGVCKWCMKSSLATNRHRMFIFLKICKTPVTYIYNTPRRHKEERKRKFKKKYLSTLVLWSVGRGGLPSLISSTLFSACVYVKWKPQINSVRREWKEFRFPYFHETAQTLVDFYHFQDFTWLFFC